MTSVSKRFTYLFYVTYTWHHFMFHNTLDAVDILDCICNVMYHFHKVACINTLFRCVVNIVFMSVHVNLFLPAYCSIKIFYKSNMFSMSHDHKGILPRFYDSQSIRGWNADSASNIIQDRTLASSC